MIKNLVRMIILLALLGSSGCSHREKQTSPPLQRATPHPTDFYLAELTMEDECMFDYFPECSSREAGD